MKRTYLITGIVILFLIAGGLFAWQKMPKAPTSTPPIPTPATSKIPKDWKTYRNEKLGFELQYPEGWFLYDEKRLLEDEKNQGGPCVGKSLENGVIFSHADLGTCVGPGGDYWPGDLLLKYFDTECTTFNLNLSKEEYMPIEINGVDGMNYPLLENTPRSSRKGTIIQLNYKNTCYTIEFSQTDNKGNHDPIFDQILSTIKFLK